MKTQIIFSILTVFVYLNANSITLTISKKNSTDPTDVCNNSILYYVTTIKDAPSSYTISWIVGKGNIEAQSTNEAKVKWIAETAGNNGTIQAKMYVGQTLVAESNVIEVTIKSILHLEPSNLTPFPNGTTYSLAPCNPGQVTLEVTKLEIPGTGTYNLEKVYNYMWTLPAGWSANGIVSTGSNEIPGGSYITASYPASSTSGTIKVKGYQAITGCTADVQSSKYATATINRNVTLNLTANKTYFLCGDTNPITYTVTASQALPCAVYYWNNSTTPTSSNTFQKVPGTGNEIVTVTVIYGTNSVSKTITIPAKTFAKLKPPIDGAPVLCSGQAEYTIAEIRPGYIVNWTGTNLTLVTNNNSSAIFSTLNPGNAYINATVTTPCGDVVPLTQKDIWVGTPPNPTIQSLNLCGSTPIEINASSTAPVSYYNWTVSCGTILSGQGTSCIMVQPNCNCYEIYVRLQTQNLCPILSPLATKYIPIDCTGPTPLIVILYPNPATSETTVSIESFSEENNLKSGSFNESFDANEEWELEVYNEKQILKERKAKLKGKCATIQTNGWKEGIYIVRVKYKDEILTEKLVVKK